MSGHTRTIGAYGVECMHCGLRPHWEGWQSKCVPLLRAPSTSSLRLHTNQRAALEARVRNAAMRAALPPEEQHAHREAMRAKRASTPAVLSPEAHREMMARMKANPAIQQPKRGAS